MRNSVPDGPGTSDPRPVPRVAAAPAVLTGRPKRIGADRLRRIALAAQGFDRPRPARPDAGHIRRTMERIALLQIDSVNVLSRSHYLPLFSRLGAYPRERLDALLSRSPRLLVEYWAHEAAFLRPELARSFGWRSQRWRERLGREAAGHDDAFAALLEDVRAALERHGPMTARQLDDLLSHEIPERPKDHWGWNHTRVRRAAELLFYGQQIGSTGRSPQFERTFAPLDVVHPALAAPDQDLQQSARTLVAAAAGALGVATLDCLADYFRMPASLAAQGVAQLETEGLLEPVETPMGRPAWLWHEARAPRRIDAAALLSPFDSLVFNRRRIEAIFGFHYRIEIYTPAAKRRYGYYVLPFLHGDRLAARVDLKADRGRRRLLIRSAWAEPGLTGEGVLALRAELETLAGWLELSGLEPGTQGDLMDALRRTGL